MRISDWSSDGTFARLSFELFRNARRTGLSGARAVAVAARGRAAADGATAPPLFEDAARRGTMDRAARDRAPARHRRLYDRRSEEHTSELQSLMRNSYAVFCLTKNKTNI